MSRVLNMLVNGERWEDKSRKKSHPEVTLIRALPACSLSCNTAHLAFIRTKLFHPPDVDKGSTLPLEWPVTPSLDHQLTLK